jgi:tetratricopeptide (TPR) repeat protein
MQPSAFSRVARLLGVIALGAAFVSAAARVEASDEADALYRRRADSASARRAADLWAARTEFEPSWKLARISYWLGTHGLESERRQALERGINAGERAVRLAPNRPEGHFWLAADMGALAESEALQGLRYRGKIKDELERVLVIDPTWQGGSADAALGQWYFEVPRLLGGSRAKAEEYLRRALMYDPDSRVALSYLAEVLVRAGRREEARALLKRVLAAPVDNEWMPEDNDFKKKAAARLKSLGS